MTVETLHDALTLLPADLVAAADRRRSRKKPTIRWQRWVAMAACFTLVLFVGSFAMLVMTPMGSSSKSMAMADQAAPMEAEEYAAEEPDAPAAQAPEAAATQAAAEVGGNTNGVTNEVPGVGGARDEALASLPVLNVLSGTGETELYAYSCSWAVPREDGAALSLEMDAAMPTDHPENLPLVETGGESLPLRWETLPESVVVRYWTQDGESWAEGSLDGGAPKQTETGEFILRRPFLDGDIYEVTAYWDQGVIRYAFRVDASE